MKNNIKNLRKTTIKTIRVLVLSALSFLSMCINAVAETTEAVPSLSREYIQYRFKETTENKAYTVLMTFLIFASAALIIPLVFFIIKKIAPALRKRKTKNK